MDITSIDCHLIRILEVNREYILDNMEHILVQLSKQEPLLVASKIRARKPP
jgi:hypothetical protein